LAKRSFCAPENSPAVAFLSPVLVLQCRHLAKLSVRGVFVGGTTGECQSLTTGERQKLFEAWGSTENSP